MVNCLLELVYLSSNQGQFILGTFELIFSFFFLLKKDESLLLISHPSLLKSLLREELDIGLVFPNKLSKLVSLLFCPENYEVHFLSRIMLGFLLRFGLYNAD